MRGLGDIHFEGKTRFNKQHQIEADYPYLCRSCVKAVVDIKISDFWSILFCQTELAQQESSLQWVTDGI